MNKRVIARILDLQRRHAFLHFLFLVGAFAFMSLILPSVWAAKKPAYSSGRSSHNKYKSGDSLETFIEGQLKKYLGVAYQPGGSTPKGMDCSGYVKVIYEEVFGVELPHGSTSQHALPILQKVSSEDLKTGDLIFFSPTGKKKKINHVGLYLSDGRFVHASRKEGVTVSSLSDPYWNARLYSTKRMKGMEIPMPGARAMASSSMDSSPYPGGEPITFQLAGFGSALRDLEGERTLVFQEPRHLLFSSELVWEKSLLDGFPDFRMSAFREYYGSYEGSGFHFLPPVEKNEALSFDNMNFSYVQGIRMASDFSPGRGLVVTPSLTYFSYGSGIDDSYLPKMSYGVDFSLGPSSRNWALSMGFQFSGLQRTAAYPSLMEQDERRLTDMAIRFRQRVTNNFHLLLTTEFSERYVPSVDEGMRGEIKEDQKFSIMLNFSY